ncbi:MAG: hypothetical protein C0448_12745 [Sphingobacteriaceae bacterium]|nr:hypothetical protein [Sphingobacteriaceae bacterium]
MINLLPTEKQIQYVSNFNEFVTTAFHGEINTICWKRELIGDFLEIIKKAETTENITVLDEAELLKLELSEQGKLARSIILNDYHLLKEHGASPTLNIIKYYERDEEHPFFPTDVYSFHVDRSPIPTETILCTYYGATSDILPNSQAEQKILIPEILDELKKQFTGSDEEFESYLIDNFFDLHYQAKPEAQIINLGLGNLWRLAVDHPESQVLPCVHRAPKENLGESRLLLIC